MPRWEQWGKGRILKRKINRPGKQCCCCCSSRRCHGNRVKKRRRRRWRRREADWSIVLCWLIWLPSTCYYRGRENQRATCRVARSPIRYMAAAWSIACWKVGNWLPFYPGESGAVTEMCSLATDSQLYFITQLVHLGDLFVCLLEIPLQSDFSLYLSKMSTNCWSRARTAPKFLSCFPSLLFYPFFAHTGFFISHWQRFWQGKLETGTTFSSGISWPSFPGVWRNIIMAHLNTRSTVAPSKKKKIGLFLHLTNQVNYRERFKTIIFVCLPFFRGIICRGWLGDAIRKDKNQREVSKERAGKQGMLREKKKEEDAEKEIFPRKAHTHEVLR